MEIQLNYEYHHWGPNKKVMEIIRKTEKSPGTLWLLQRRRETTKRGNFQFKFDCNINQKI